MRCTTRGEVAYPPIFIGGAGRSGTTILADIVGLHNDISPIYETDFVTALAQLFYSTREQGDFEDRKQKYRAYVHKWSDNLPRRPHNKREHEKYVHGPHYIRFDKEYMRLSTEQLLRSMTPENKDEAIRDYISDLFAESARRDEKSHWVNKTPSYVLYPHFLLRWFPDLKFIHIIRDGRDAAISAMTRPWGPKSIDQAAQWWIQNVQSGLKFGERNPNNYVELKFEDLIRKPESTLRFLFRECGTVDVDRLDVAGMIRQAEHLDAEMTEKWRLKMGTSDHRVFWSRAGTLLSSLGYPHG